jgi:DNA (cytosine-5)-methyltransferase 1
MKKVMQAQTTIRYRDLLDHLTQTFQSRASEAGIPDGEFLAEISHYLQSEGVRSIWGNSLLPKMLEDEATSYAKTKNLKIRHSRDVWSALDHSDIRFPPPMTPSFTFADVFAGIGGFRIALQNLGGKCVFSCEWDKYAKKTYLENFGEFPFGDVRQFTDPNKIDDETLDSLVPDHDILAAGFPCQPFSLAGVSKKKSLGRKHGFEDPTQGTLFFDIKRILRVKKPAAFFLENVKHLLTHDKKRTFTIILETLEEELGYITNFAVIDAAKWVPQHRERVFIVGYNPEKVKISKDKIFFPKEPEKDYVYPELSRIILARVDPKHTLGPGTWATLVRHREHHARAGNGFGYGLLEVPVQLGKVTRTISARYHKDGAEILIGQRAGKRPRRLTVYEAMQIQGLDPERFCFPVSDTQAYRQIGNSVAIPAVDSTAKEIVRVLRIKSKPVIPPFSQSDTASIDLSDRNTSFFRKTLAAWGHANHRVFPWRSDTLQFHALIAEILLQRTKAEQVVPVYRAFIKRFPDLQALQEATEDDIYEVIRPLGLKWRSRLLKELAGVIKDGIPEDVMSLVKLPAVGPYAAAAYLSMHEGRRCPIIDSNVVRLCGRYFGFVTDAETRRKRFMRDLAEKLTPFSGFKEYNYALLDFCALVCRPKPLCSNCPLRGECFFCQSKQIKDK